MITLSHQSPIWFYLALSVLCIQLSTVPAFISKSFMWKPSERKVTYKNRTVVNVVYQVIHTLHFCYLLSTILNIQDPLQHNFCFFPSKDIPVWSFFPNPSILFPTLAMVFHLWNNTFCKRIEKNRFLCFSCCQPTAHFWFCQVG